MNNVGMVSINIILTWFQIYISIANFQLRYFVNKLGN